MQAPLNFPMWVYGVDRGTPDLMVHITRGLSETLVAHRDDESVTASADLIDQAGSFRRRTNSGPCRARRDGP